MQMACRGGQSRTVILLEVTLRTRARGVWRATLATKRDRCIITEFLSQLVVSGPPVAIRHATAISTAPNIVTVATQAHMFAYLYAQ